MDDSYFSQAQNIPLNIKNKTIPTPLLFGKDEHGYLYSIEEVPRGLACNCLCPACHSPLEARKGEHRTHHFAHVNNTECLYGSDIALYQAVCKILNEQKRLFVPNICIDKYGDHHPEILIESQILNLTSIHFYNDAKHYPPRLLCCSENYKCQIILNIDSYYNDADLSLIRTYAKNNHLDVIKISLNTSDHFNNFQKLQLIIESPINKDWIYNQTLEQKRNEYHSKIKAHQTQQTNPVLPYTQKTTKNISHVPQKNADSSLNVIKEKPTKEVRFNEVKNKFTQQAIPIRDSTGMRWIKCEICSCIKEEIDFAWYGGLNQENSGTCTLCSRKTI